MGTVLEVEVSLTGHVAYMKQIDFSPPLETVLQYNRPITIIKLCLIPAPSIWKIQSSLSVQATKQGHETPKKKTGP